MNNITTFTEIPCENFKIDHRKDGILIYRLESLNTDTIQCWINNAQLHETETRTALRRVLDIRHVADMITNQTLPAVKRMTCGLRHSYAILISEEVSYHAVKVVMQCIPHGTAIRIFAHEDGAILWLDQQLLLQQDEE